MKYVLRIGWVVVIVALVLLLALGSPFGLLLLWIGVPMVFAGSVAKALRRAPRDGGAGE